MLNDRTAVETGEPLGVDLESDELAFFPLLYWPITPDQPPLSADRASSSVNAYLRERRHDPVRHRGPDAPAAPAAAMPARACSGCAISRAGSTSRRWCRCRPITC